MNKVTIPLGNGYNLIAEQNPDSAYNKEIFIDIETESGACHQSLALVRPKYHYENEKVIYEPDRFEVLVYGDANLDDVTNIFKIPLFKDDE